MSYQTRFVRHCVDCGGEFNAYSADPLFFRRQRCRDCLLVERGEVRIEEKLSVATWWKPWTWGRTKVVIEWDAETAKSRIAERRKARSAAEAGVTR